MTLREDTLFGQRDKVDIAIERIRTLSLPDDSLFVAFSGGKDSAVLLDLVERSEVAFEAQYNATTVDPPELVHHIREHYIWPGLVRESRPQESMWQLIQRHGMLPTRVARYCCQELKERKTGGRRLIATGVRWEESPRRRSRRLTEACMQQAGKFFLHPIIDWTTDEIWEYIRERNLPYCSLYDEGFRRVGCIMCPFSDQRAEAERWPKFARAYRRAAHGCIEKARETGRLESKKRHFKDGDQYYQWWISGKSSPQMDARQGRIFE